MNTKAINSNLLIKLKDKKYRDLFIASQINKIIPFQIRALRAARNNMTQEELAERAETTQSVISRIQNKGVGSLNIKSLIKLAAAFDVALVVRFEPIDRFIDWVDDLSPELMSPKPSEDVIAEIEREALQQNKAVKGAVKAATAHMLRVIKPEATAIPLQPMLAFDVPYRSMRVIDGNPVVPSKSPDATTLPLANVSEDSTVKHLRVGSGGN